VHPRMHSMQSGHTQVLVNAPTVQHQATQVLCLCDGKYHTHVDGPFLCVHVMKVNGLIFSCLCIKLKISL
jgi:hypothetical protein